MISKKSSFNWELFYLLVVPKTTVYLATEGVFSFSELWKVLRNAVMDKTGLSVPSQSQMRGRQQNLQIRK